jgi:heme oxygenase (mycobilin-producing)
MRPPPIVRSEEVERPAAPGVPGGPEDPPAYDPRMAVTALLDLHLRPEALAEAPAALTAILTDTRAFEGSLGVEVLQDVADPAHVTVVERWASLERDEAYRAWRATPEGASGLGDLLAAPPVLTKYETQSSL